MTDSEEEEKRLNRHQGGSSTSSTPTEEPTQIPDVNTEPLEMTGGSGVVSVPNISVSHSMYTSLSLRDVSDAKSIDSSSQIPVIDLLRSDPGIF